MARATELVHIPLNAGQREDTDKRLLPHGLLRRAKNVRLRRSGAIGVRHGFSATPNTDDEDSSLTVYDVASHDDVLLAFGTTNASAGGPEAVYTLTGSAWRGEDHSDGRPRSFSAISEVREAYRPAFAKTDEAVKYDVAYAGGYVALVYEGHADEGAVFVSVFDPTTGAELLQERVASRTNPRVAAAGDSFVFAWVVTGAVNVSTFDPATDVALGAEATRHNTGTVAAGLDLAGVSGASEVVLFVAQTNGTTALYRLNAAGAVQASGALTRSDVSVGTLVTASSGSTHVAYVDTTGNYELETLSTATFTSAVGPTALFGGDTGSRPPGVAVKNATQVVVTAALTDTIDQQLRTDVRAVSNHAANAALTQREVSAMSKPFVSPDGQFVGVVSPYAGDSLINYTGIVDAEHGRGYETAVHRGFAVDALADHLGSVATDGTRHWAVFPVTDLNCSHTPVVMEWRAMSPERRQTAGLGGMLYIAGGFVAVWDGKRLVESGFVDAPTIVSATPSNSTGELTNSAQYSYRVTYEWVDGKGNRHISPVSEPVVVTMGASDDTVTLVVSSPHSIRRVVGSTTGVKILVYRTLAFPDRVHRRAVVGYGTTTYAETVSLVDTASDAELTTQSVLYTQGARGALSGPLQHDAPEPASYLWGKRDRILCGGLPDESRWQQSKRLFPAEPAGFSNFLGFFGSVGSRQLAVASQDETDYIYTRNNIYAVDGAGPDDNGNGEFNAPREIPGDAVGCIDWRSLVANASGVWFQGHPDRLYVLPRGGGAPEWRSQPVRDTLAEFPVVTAAAVVSRDNTVCWAVTNTAGTAGRLVCHDTRSGDWYVDELDDLGGPITSMCEHNGGLAVVSGGRVYLQDTAFPASAFIGYSVETGSVAPFGTEGHGKTVGVTLTAEYRGDCQLEGEVSYDDGLTYAPMGDSPFTVENKTVGESLAFQWYPRRRKGSRFSFRFTASAHDGASEGLLLHNMTLEVQVARGARRAVRGDRR